MRRFVALLLILCAVVSIFGCTKQPAEEKPGGEQSETVGAEKDITFMVYMVGSDLEAKGGAGSDDLEEMAESGVDLSRVNVLVYAGGSKKWHNDTVTADDGHTLLALGENGFEKKQIYENSSMGEPEPLTRFLTYAKENYPAKEFALVMWDHGDGPLIGYGKDMLFDNDSLTLGEMRSALKASPFAGENKLSWIGFDACLMSSAELAVTLKDHATYLVASQEIEPAFGWNYTFLSNLGKRGTEEMLSSLCEGYLSDCEKYYERKGFEGRDTTLALMDLSVAGELEDAICDLFSSADVKKNYNTLAKRRAASRALGRASTGSEYDLVDLYDLADKMSADYGDKAERLKDAVKKMVKANAVNADGLCGLSIYYPFYNKSYYEKSWGEVYSELGVLTDYAEYLDGYSKIWLGGDYVEETATSEKPEADGKNKYTLTLTDEQAETYADAKYYILYREGDELYTKMYSSGNVEIDDNKLTAYFDGDVLYAKNDLGQYMLPVTEEHDTVGEYTRYSIYANLTNETPLIGDKPEGYQHKVGGYRFQLAADNETKKISTSALVPYNASVDAGSLTGGKLEDADTSQYSMYYFIQERHRYLERYENGAIKPVDEWRESDYLSAYTSRIGDGLEFVFAPLPEGEYYLIFEIEDTQGSKYCSEMISVKTDKKTPMMPEMKVYEAEWENGEKVKLLDEENVEIYLTTLTKSYGGTRYNLEVKNGNDFKIAVLGMSVMYNESVYCPDGSFGFFSVGAGETCADDVGFSFGDAADLEVMCDLSSLQFTLKVTTYTGDKTIIPETGFNVKLSDETKVIPPVSVLSEGFYDYDTVSRDILAGKQKLGTYDGLEYTLLGLGGNGMSDGRLNAAFLIENKSDTDKHFAFDGINFDGIFVESESGPITLPAGCKMYRIRSLSAELLDDFMVSSPKSVSFCLHQMEYATLEGGGGFSTPLSFSVKLDEKGKGSSFDEGSKVLMNEYGVKLTFLKSDYDSERPSPYRWYITVENESGKDISLRIKNVELNGEAQNLESFSCPVLYRYGKVLDGCDTIFLISSSDDKDKAELTFDVEVYDFALEKMLWTSSESITLTGRK